MRRSELILLPLAFILLAPALASPDFSPFVAQGGFFSPEIVSTSQQNVDLGFWVLVNDSSSGFIENITIDVSSLNSAGHILLSPSPGCPAELSAGTVRDNTTMICSANRSLGELGINVGEWAYVTFRFDAIQGSVGSNPKNILFTLRDSSGNQTSHSAQMSRTNRRSRRSSPWPIRRTSPSGRQACR
jgi:hypothetical protein